MANTLLTPEQASKDIAVLIKKHSRGLTKKQKAELLNLISMLFFYS